MRKWKATPVRDLCSEIIDCVNKTAPVVPGPTPFKMIRTTNVKRGRVDLDSVRYVTEDVYNKWTRRGVPQDRDIILTREAPLGEVGMLRQAGGVFLGQRLVLYRADEEVADQAFLLYAMRSPQVAAQIAAFGSGSTVQHMRVPDCGEILITHPTPDRQRRIGAVLAAFDELIEINERRIALLEDAARSLYREWFVHFRFPGHENTTFIGSDIGAVPDGWPMLAASSLLHINPRRGAQQSEYKKFGMAALSDRRSYLFETEVTTRPTGSRFRNGDVLFARITPCLQNGKTALVTGLEDGEVGVGSTEFIVLEGNVVGPAYVYGLARDERFRQHAIQSMVGASGRQRVSVDCFDSFVTAEPPEQIANHFEDLARPLLDEAFQRARHNRALAATRDLLLPRLVTGQLDLDDVDLGDLLPAAAA